MRAGDFFLTFLLWHFKLFVLFISDVSWTFISLTLLGRTLNSIRTTSYIAILHNYMISLKILSKNWANMSDLCSFCVIRLKCSICDFKTKPSYSSVEWCTSCGYGCIIALFPINLFFNGFHRAAFVIAGKSHVFRSLSKSCKKKCECVPGSLSEALHMDSIQRRSQKPPRMRCCFHWGKPHKLNQTRNAV